MKGGRFLVQEPWLSRAHGERAPPQWGRPFEEQGTDPWEQVKGVEPVVFLPEASFILRHPPQVGLCLSFSGSSLHLGSSLPSSISAMST